MKPCSNGKIVSAQAIWRHCKLTKKIDPTWFGISFHWHRLAPRSNIKKTDLCTIIWSDSILPKFVLLYFRYLHLKKSNDFAYGFRDYSSWSWWFATEGYARYDSHTCGLWDTHIHRSRHLNVLLTHSLVYRQTLGLFNSSIRPLRFIVYTTLRVVRGLYRLKCQRHRDISRSDIHKGVKDTSKSPSHIHGSGRYTGHRLASNFQGSASGVYGVVWRNRDCSKSPYWHTRRLRNI